MDYLLGFDGGGTHTRAVLLTTQGRVLGLGQAGASNYHNVGAKSAAHNLRAAADAAFGQAGLVPAPAKGVFLGLAGVKASGDIARMRAAAEGVGLAEPGQIEVANDLSNALAGGHDGEPGIALIAGTGSNCLGRDSSGTTWMCGGWGWLLDDLGAGFGIAVCALRRATRAADGRGASTRLLASAMAFFGLSEPNALLERLYVGKWEPSLIAEFCEIVVRLAKDGDQVALEVLKEGAESLAELVAATATKLNFSKRIPVVLLGGCARSGPPYQPLIEEAICRLTPRASICEPVHDTVYGAALNALRFAGRIDVKPQDFPNR